MEIGVIGVGKIGLGIALNFADLGHKVIGYDISEKRVQSLNNKKLKFKEPNYDNLLNKCNNFISTSRIADLFGCDIIFIMVKTDSLPNGEYNCSQIESVYEELIKYNHKNPVSLVLCSNVNPGYSEELSKKLINNNYLLSFNPEWVAQGEIFNNLRNPDSVIIGEANKKEGDKLETLYKSFTTAPIYRMDLTSAEICKIGYNCFLTTKIAYANSLGDLAIKMGKNPDPILQAIGDNSKIGNKFFKYGHSYGGPCFPRDNRALSYTFKLWDLEPTIQKSIDKSNEDHLQFMVDQFVKNNDPKIPFTVEDVTYKPGVPYIEESKQLEYIVLLARKGFNITIKQDSQIINEIKNIYGDLFKYITND